MLIVKNFGRISCAGKESRVHRKLMNFATESVLSGNSFDAVVTILCVSLCKRAIESFFTVFPDSVRRALRAPAAFSAGANFFVISASSVYVLTKPRGNRSVERT